MLSLTSVSFAAAAGAITLDPTTQAPGAAVSVSGTSFGATQSIGIGFGTEVPGSDTNMAYTGTGMGPYTGRVSNYPIKPGTFVLTSDTSAGGGLVSTYTDNGNGTLSGSFEGATGTINYVTGVWTRMTTVDVTGIATNYGATYTRYQFNVTPAGGAATDGAGAFTASITVPTVTSGTYTVTAIDTNGNIATSSLVVSVDTVPESWSMGVVMLISAVAVVIGAGYFRKRPKAYNRRNS
jgi:hypothetical protein